MNKSSYLSVSWPEAGTGKPDNVFAVTTLVTGGISKGDYSGYNLATHVGDDPEAVKANRVKLVTDLRLPAEPVWLDQVHSSKVVNADELAVADPAGEITPVRADASISRTKGVVCAVLTADCLPVFFCNRDGTEVAVAHAGWRGLLDGILEQGAEQVLKASHCLAEDILVWFGPAIGPEAFEVGDEVANNFRVFFHDRPLLVIKNRASGRYHETDTVPCGRAGQGYR